MQFTVKLEKIYKKQILHFSIKRTLFLIGNRKFLFLAEKLIKKELPLWPITDKMQWDCIQLKDEPD